MKTMGKHCSIPFDCWVLALSIVERNTCLYLVAAPWRLEQLDRYRRMFILDCYGYYRGNIRNSDGRYVVWRYNHNQFGTGVLKYKLFCRCTSLHIHIIFYAMAKMSFELKKWNVEKSDKVTHFSTFALLHFCIFAVKALSRVSTHIFILYNSYQLWSRQNRT